MTDETSQLGAYRLDGLLGQGGMAAVHRAWHTGLHRYEALKILPPHLAHDRDFVERFLAEARMAARLRHPHIATIYAVSDPGSPQPFFAMEFIEGEDLSSLLARRGALPLPECLLIVRQMAGALDYSHSQGIVHRDIKPANVLLHKGEEGDRSVKIVDFGIAHAQEAGGRRLTRTGMIIGTPEYMSPEQGAGKGDIDYRTDIYSLGVVVYEMLCGRPPFPGENVSAISVIMNHLQDAPRSPKELVPGLPEAVNTAVLTALAKSPSERFQSCAAFADALAAGLPKPAVAQSDSGPATAVPRSRAYPALAIVPLVLLIAGGALIGGRAWLANAHSAAPPILPEPPVAAARKAKEAKEKIDAVEMTLKYYVVHNKKHPLTEDEAKEQREYIRSSCVSASELAGNALALDSKCYLGYVEYGYAHYYMNDCQTAEKTALTGLEYYPKDSALLMLLKRAQKRLATANTASERR